MLLSVIEFGAAAAVPYLYQLFPK